MATKKKSGKKSGGKKKNVLDTDPPILVGGGGSSFIWIKKELEPQLVDGTSVPASAPQPLHPDQYYCFRVNKNVGTITLVDGNAAPPDPPKGVNSRFHLTTFE